jgi:hypothetical protein
MNTQTGRTRKAKMVKFFYDHAGYSYDPNTETRIQGRKRCARNLADAEEQARANNWSFEWQDDWSVCDHVQEFDTYTEQPKTCEGCILRDESGKVLASLWCIDDADANYRRVVEAELAEEAL